MTVILETTAACRRTPLVLFLLEELATPFEVVVRDEGYFTTHHHALGPLVRDGDDVVIELDAVLRFLARRFGAGTLMPADPTGCAAVDRFMEVQSSLRGAAVRLVREGSASTDALALVRRSLEALEAALAGRDYLLGELTVADIPAVMLAQLARVGVDLSATPRVEAWAARVAARPAWARVAARLRLPAAEAGPSSLERACREWTERLGAAHVIRAPEALAHAGRTTLPAAARPVAILRPTARAEVAEIVRIAARHRVPLHPISAGCNWGWGDACPAGEGQVVLDLGGLTSIEIDEDLGVAVIEPGVTQGALARHLEATGSAWRLDCAGSGPRASLVGNALERGLTFGTYGERFEAVSGLEVVLADGSVVRTGAGAYGASRAGRARRGAVGPSLDGLFSQSSLGVVTELGLWLTPRPAHEEMVWLTCEDEALPALIDALRPLRLRGVLPTNVHLFQLPPRSPGGSPTWAGNGAICGSAAAVAAHVAEVEAAVAALARFTLSSRTPPGPALCDALLLPDMPGLELLIDTSDRLVRGEALEMPPAALLAALGGPEVQRPTTPPTSSDPRDAGYGLVFSWQAVPAVGDDVRRLVALARERLAAHGCPPLMAVQFSTGRAATLVTRIVYDRKVEGRCAAALACQRALHDDALAEGFPPARMNLVGHDALATRGAAYWALVERLRHALDPDGILSPGRHTPGGAR
ncbi:MAG: FAD-binding protein [Sandaracinaceae bacterium]|nr:FAD-binding protein [Sandaracinaceae bacterium]